MFGEFIFQKVAQMKRTEIRTGRIWDKSLYLVLVAQNFKFKFKQQVQIYRALRWYKTFGFTTFFFVFSVTLFNLKNNN